MMSWIWPDYIHRDLQLTKQERRAIHRVAWQRWWANKWNIVLYLMLPAFYLLTVFFASDVGGRIATTIGVSGLICKLFRAAAPLALFVVCFVAGGAIFQRYRFAPCVYQATRQHGHDVCTTCGYWLRGLEDGVENCPECGAARASMTSCGAGSKSRADAGDR